MNMDDFRYIITVADLGSFTQAAQKLYIAQPSLSQRVKHIEKTYDISLFKRDTKGVSLTREGEIFTRYAQDILKSESDLKRELDELKNPEKQTLRISSSKIIRSYLMTSLIHHYHAAYPQVSFDFREGIPGKEQQALLLDGKVDIGVFYLPVHSDDLEYQVIFEDSYVLVPASDSRLERRIREYSPNGNEPVPVRFLEGEPLAAASPGTRLGSYIESIRQRYQVDFDIQHYSKSYSTLYTIARTGMASTILYESFIDPSQKHIPYYYLEDDETLQAVVAWRKNAFLGQAAKNFIDFSRVFSVNQSRYVQHSHDQSDMP